MRNSHKAILATVAAFALTGFGDDVYFANKRGNEHYQEGKYDEALTEYRGAQAGDPKDKNVDYNLGGAYYQLGEYGEAGKAYARAMETDDEALKRNSMFNLGSAMYKAGEALEEAQKIEEAMQAYQSSAEQFKRYLKKDRKDNDARHNLELALSKIKDMEQKQKEQEQQEQDQKDQPEQNKEQKPESGQDGKNEKQEDEQSENGDQQKKEEQPENSERKMAGEITAEQAKRIFDAIERDEKELKKKMRAEAAESTPQTGKDW